MNRVAIVEVCPNRSLLVVCITYIMNPHPEWWHYSNHELSGFLSRSSAYWLGFLAESWKHHALCGRSEFPVFSVFVHVTP